jgi:uncharacterized protein YacL
MHRKTIILMRVLALASALEGIVGLYFVALFLRALGEPHAKNILTALPQSKLVYHLMVPADLGLIAGLLISAWLLWDLRPRGLKWLAAIVASEVTILLCSQLAGAFSDFNKLPQPVTGRSRPRALCSCSQWAWGSRRQPPTHWLREGSSF